MKTLQNYFKDWNLFEKLWLALFTIINIYLFFVWKDTVVGLITSLTGMMCVVLVAKGKISNYWFGIVNTLLYAYIAYNQKYYGEVMLNALYFFPMQFIGIYMWNKHKVEGKKDDVKSEFMNNKTRVFWLITSIILTYIYGLILQNMGGKLPFIDSMSTIFSIIAMILMAKRYMEQWVLWIIVDVVTIIMWFVVFIETGNDISMLIMWTAYFINAIYGMLNWIKLHRVQSQVKKAI